MVMASRTRSAAGIAGIGLGAWLLLAPSFAHAAAVDIYYERALMGAANARCGLFPASVAASLNAATIQARNAALREGADPAALDAAARRAGERAGRESCGSTDLRAAAERVRAGYEGFVQLQTLSYPGEIADWEASRHTSRNGRMWSLSQSTTFGADKLTFGLTTAGAASELIAVVQFADGARPYAAHLVTRDTAIAPRPFLGGRGPGTAQAPLSTRIPPQSQRDSHIAEARFDPDQSIRPQGKAPSVAYRFSTDAARALTRLDPREAVAIEFYFSTPSGSEVRRAYIEVGDFAAGVAFLAAAQR
jgi:hypothetical protein